MSARGNAATGHVSPRSANRQNQFDSGRDVDRRARMRATTLYGGAASLIIGPAEDVAAHIRARYQLLAYWAGCQVTKGKGMRWTILPVCNKAPFCRVLLCLGQPFALPCDAASGQSLCRATHRAQPALVHDLGNTTTKIKGSCKPRICLGPVCMFDDGYMGRRARSFADAVFEY